METMGHLGGRPSIASRLRRMAVATTFAITAVLAGPVPSASAHATLLFTSPSVDGAVPTSPEAIQLVFDQEVVPSGSSLRLADDTGRTWPLGTVESGARGQTMSAQVLDTLPVGGYIVRWQAVAPDADAMLGEYRFAVGSTSGLSLGGGNVTTDGVAITTALRWLLFAGLALSLGGLLGGVLSDRAGRSTGESAPRPWVRGGALLGGLASACLALVVVGGGSVLEGFRSLSLDSLLSNAPGRLAVMEVGAFGVAAVASWMNWRRVAALFLLLVPVAEGLRAHPQAVDPGLGATVTAVHLIAAAIWIGSLVHVVRVGNSWRRRGVSAAALVGSYARLALWLFLAVVLSGSIAGLSMIPLDELTPTLFGTTYGRWLLAKLALVLLVVVLALCARAHLRRRTPAPQPSRSARWEVSALASVLAISGLLTALAPPVQADLPLPFPPPPVGPVVAVGGRAGFIGVGITASNGQVLVRLTAPDLSPALDDAQDHEYSLGGTVGLRGDDESAELRFRACGVGCFVAPVDWRSGVSTMALAVEAESVAGGTTAVSLAWPPRSAPEELKRVVAAMNEVRSLVLYEQVTSDSAEELESPQSLRLSGRAFLKSDPFASGIAPVVNVMSRSEGETTLAVAYPAVGTYILLTVDTTGRIIREQLAAAKHMVYRTFVYPEANSDEHEEHNH